MSSQTDQQKTQSPSSTADKSATVAETNKAKPTKSEQTKSNKSWAILGWTLVILLLGSSAGGYFVWDFVNQAKQQLQHDINNLVTRNTELSDLLSAAKSDFTETVVQLKTYDKSLQNSIKQILSQNLHLRKDWLVIEAEYLVKLASHRLILEGDINTAISALQSADTRLRETGDPAVLSVRKIIRDDITSLRAIAQPDISGISLQLSSIIQHIDQLPLNTPDPASILNNQQEKDIDFSQWTQLGSVIWQDLRSLVTVRQHDQPVHPLLSPEQRFFLTQNLKLQLEQARTALLHSQSKTYTERLSIAQGWIKLYFKNSAKQTKSMLEQLAVLIKSEIKPSLPTLHSYQALQSLKFEQKDASITSKPDPASKTQIKANTDSTSLNAGQDKTSNLNADQQEIAK